MAERLLLVRHGETAWNLDYRYNSSTDIELDAAARPKLEAVARRLSRYPIRRVLCSPAARAVRSAQLLTGLQPELSEDLRELGFGAFEGLTRDELTTGPLASAFAAWLTGVDGSPAAPGGETWLAAASRARHALCDAGSDGNATGTTLVVSHGYLLKIMLLCALEAPAGLTRTLRWSNAGVTEIIRDGGRWSLVGYNWLP